MSRQKQIGRVELRHGWSSGASNALGRERREKRQQKGGGENETTRKKGHDVHMPLVGKRRNVPIRGRKKKRRRQGGRFLSGQTSERETKGRAVGKRLRKSESHPFRRGSFSLATKNERKLGRENESSL